MTSTIVSVYYELSWAILSTIGIVNVCLGVLVIGITSCSAVAAVPLTVSTACAIANGLCYYSYYREATPAQNQAVASAFADFLWMVQEAGLSFYSYFILSRMMRDRKWYIFAGLFWFIFSGIVAFRVCIAVTRVRLILSDTSELQNLVNSIHIGYFASIAILECLSAYFLLETFASAKTTSLRAAIQTRIFKYLMRSAEVQVASPAILGTLRAVTYSFQVMAQSATNVASQLDRFSYTWECLFPMVMYIDILASKLVFSNHVYVTSNKLLPNHHPRFFTTNRNGDFGPTTQGETTVEIQGGFYVDNTANSKERIDGEDARPSTPRGVGSETSGSAFVGISKTVEFVVHKE